MPIPTRFDHQMGEVENAATVIMLSLRTLRHANPRDVDRMRVTLRERLQDFADLVVRLANEGAQ
jgi:hypothetical protein